MVYANRVIETSSNTPANTGTVSVSLSGTSPTMTFIGTGTSAGRLFDDVLASTDTCIVHIYQTNDPSLWCEVQATFTSAATDTLTFVAADVKDGSAGAGTLVTWTGAVTCEIVAGAHSMRLLEIALQAITPGGRLTLESGVPLSSTDQTAKTNIYYTPYTHNIIVLWDGQTWIPIVFTEYTLALGTLTSGKPYDVFAYLNAGALALEVLVWTDDTTRATAVTLQDGRYCKSGDKTRLLLGTFYTTSTTTTADAQATRYLSNVYNAVPRKCRGYCTTSHTYATGTTREFNGGTGVTRGQFISPVVTYGVTITGAFNILISGASTGGHVGLALNSTTSLGDTHGFYLALNSNDLAEVRSTCSVTQSAIVGKNYMTATQYGLSGTTYADAYFHGMVRT